MKDTHRPAGIPRREATRESLLDTVEAAPPRRLITGSTSLALTAVALSVTAALSVESSLLSLAGWVTLIPAAVAGWARFFKRLSRG